MSFTLHIDDFAWQHVNKNCHREVTDDHTLIIRGVKYDRGGDRTDIIVGKTRYSEKDQELKIISRIWLSIPVRNLLDDVLLDQQDKKDFLIHFV